MVTDENAVSDSTEQTTSDGEASADAKSAAAELASDSKAKQDSKNGDVDAVKEELSKLQEQLKTAEEKAGNHWDELLRAKAELENTRRRLQRDVENAHKYAVEKFVQDLLPVIDSLEMGINAANEVDADILKVKEGNELTLKMFNDCANKFGVEAIDPTGEEFNPEFHQAMAMQESNEQEPNTVLAVMQKGYLLNGRLIRPAMVIVAKAAEKNEAQDTEKKEQ